MGGLSAASGATVNFKDCAVYAAGKTIGGTGANVSVENCWISAGFAGNLRVTRSTLEGEHSGGTVKIDRRSNANLTDASGKAVTGVTDHSGNPVYRTKEPSRKTWESTTAKRKLTPWEHGWKSGWRTTPR